MEIVLLKDNLQYFDEVLQLSEREWEGLFSKEKWIALLTPYKYGDKISSCFLAIEKNELLGFATIREKVHNIPHLSPWLFILYVKEQHRKKGIGRKLIEKVEDLARELGYRTIYLGTEDKAEYYKKLNWTELEPLNVNGIRVVLMKKNL